MSVIDDKTRSLAQPGRISGFLKDERGSFSIEAVIWMPIFAILLAVVMNISLVFFNQSQVLRVVQDANRLFSLGRVDSSEDVATYVRSEIGYLSDDMTVTSSVVDGLIATQVRIPAIDLMPMNFMTSLYESVEVTVSAQHIVEY